MKNRRQAKSFSIRHSFLGFFLMSVFLGTVVLFAFADAAHAAIAFDAASEGHNTSMSEVTSLTVSHTVGAGGTNRVLVVGVNIFDASDPFPSVSSVTYAGQSMTRLAAAIDPVAPTRIRSEMWYIKAPATGTNDIVITLSASVRGVVAGGMSYTGVHQAAPFGTAATAGGSSTAPSVVVSSATGELVVDTVGIRQNTSGNQTLTKGAGQTERYNDASAYGTFPDNNNVVGAGSEEAGAASVTMSWTASSSGVWAIVAAPLKPIPLYRSVGTNGNNLNNGGPTVTISGTTAIFSGSMPNNIGVGDALTYNSGGNRLAFIYGRTSSTVFTVEDKNGDTPTAAPAGTAAGVYRSYTSLANWQSQTENPNIVEPVENDVNPSKNLVSAGTVLNVACYADGDDTTRVEIDGWTTGANNYINIYTPYLPSEVGARQRHMGTWASGGYKLVAAYEWNGVFYIRDEYVRVTGLRIENTAVKGNRPAGVDINIGNSEVRVSHNIIRATGTGTGDWFCAGILQRNGGGVLKAWNNIIYDWGDGVYQEYTSGSSSLTLYNNTIVNSTDAGINIGNHVSGTYRLANNLVQGPPGYNYYYPSVTLAYSSTNLSQDGTAPAAAGGGGAPLTNKTVTFVGAADFHLSASDTNAKDRGTNLSSDANLAFSDDIEGQNRNYGSAWDIGADEYAGAGAFEYRRSITVDRTKIRNPATFPIAFDAVSSAETPLAAGAISLTWSHTIGSGRDPILIVGVSIRNDSNQSVSTVTYNGTALTRIGFVTNPATYPPGYVRTELWYLPGASFPGTPGAYNVVVTLSASARFVAGAFSLFNVDPTTPLGAFASNSGTGNPTWAASVDVPSANGEIVVATLAKRYDDPVQPEQNAHQADRWNRTTHDVSANNVLGAGTLRGGAAPNTSPYWALGGTTANQQWAIAAVSVKPTTVAPPQIMTLANYPLLVSLTDDTLKYPANCPGGVSSPTCGHVYNSNGYDIIFRAFDATTCGGTAPCMLDHEIEKYDGVNGQVVAWVRLPSVNGAGAASNTQIYMYYGDGSISSPTQNKTAVWDANYMDVFHLGEPSGDATDSTSNGYVAMVQPQPGTPTHPAAKIDGGYHFTSDSWLLTNDGQFTVANAPFTIESWFYIESGAPTWVGIATKNRDVSCTDNPPYCDWAGVWIGGSGELTYAWDWHNQANMGGGAALSTGTWYYGAIAFDGGIRTGYRNGSRDTVITSPNPSPGVYTRLIMPTRMNKDLAAGGMITGTIDEVRISTVARTPGWILTGYNNLDNPGNIGTPGFYTVGNEENFPPTAVRLASFGAKAYDGGVLLQWRTGYEVNNLGFHVYREENGQLVRLTPEPVAGSALLAGSRTALTAGHHYHWWDAGLSPQSSLLKYWLKDIDLNGTETMHGPVTPVFSREPIPERFKPELLSEVGWRLQERYHHYWKVQALKEKFGQKRLEVRGAPRGRGLRTGNKVPSRSGPAGLEGRGFHRKPDLSASEVQKYLAGKPAVKLFVKEEGWYQVSQPELVAAGLSSKVNPKYLQLYVEGQEQTIRVLGGKDGKFGSRDAIEFYGTGLDTPSSDTRVYWLVEGVKPGKRIDEFRSNMGSLGSLSLSSFPYTVQVRDRWIYLPAIKNGEEENFFGAVVYGGGVEQLLEVKHLDLGSSEDALLEVVLRGATSGSHQVKVLLNNESVGEVAFEGQSKGLLQVGVPQSLLLEGDNLVSLIPLGGDMDVSLVDTIRLTYWHTYTAENDDLRFSAQGGSHLTLGGFISLRIRVFDTTDPRNVVEAIGKVESQKGSYAVSFRVPGTGQRTLLALTEEEVKSPEGITANQPSSWHQVKDGYDVVIVTHRDFIDSLQPLKKLRESQGLRVALIDVEDLYDEFSFGNKSPKALKDFLSLAKRQWKRSPRFMLLVGDASFDPKNYFGLGDLDFVPTKLIDTAYMETASDDWFVDLNNDGLPEMAIGRLPVQTADEAAIVVSKIVGYERSSKKNEALLVADRSDNSDDFNFEGASEEIWSLLPSSLTVRKIYRSQFGSDAQLNGVLLGAINQGPLLVNFIGHGSIEIWRGNIFTSDDAEALINGMQLPFFVNMTCLNGYFQDPYSETLGEALIKAKGGGAIAVWTSSGLTEPDKQAVMNKELIRLLFNGERLTLGEATARAKKVVSGQDIRKTWILFGDPTTKLK